ncbi:NADH dehydrogenase subunit 3 (mitochondrion) [Dictyostelium discoideum]|uniref:NADH-ubiquinone oxidoreductase chain 3 n=1 Tax=Dictyostelium discoideum TaxID=44689 RepID=NU3M_DICDI|nr:NADH dehydrogenase subunit 3 [Dictyostelium discoideum]Q37312.1 RecName: Full=NADH-ubiquinone oxidoreductase chain 3; AltName: Full=NADH dehydrogenase subunit 3 [Dictyostelium discoideum]BAA03934.1 NADH dehydrogenase subunit 3 [Dictyostelium discoideum]BAA78062.1 NADH dehydrogenase subunit 3 [Dictyostelium discoideum]|eukprot:NP_050080.1 NADH dehydrogenase subunit 3 (mitochondrion) [Dictyostelium discoideum]
MGVTFEFVYILVLLAISTGLSVILFFLGYFLMFKVAYEDKLMGYECGFDPFGNARGEFDIRFYLVAILFLIFDLEITFLFPFSVSIMSMTLLSYSLMLIFLIILTIGFIYEIKKGALDWS